MRLDILDGCGGSSVPRMSASTISNSSTSSTGLVPPCPKPLQPGGEQETHNLLIIDHHTFEGFNTDHMYSFIIFEQLLFYCIFLVLHAYQFVSCEYATSLVSCKLGNDPNHYFAVGTAYVNPDEAEPKQVNIFHFL